MDLTNLSDQTLIERAVRLAREEREVLSKVLNHLFEIHRRKLFSTLGYKSLFEFAVKKLEYSEDQAYRRIAAMRIIQEIPLVEEKICDGSLNLSLLGLAHKHFKNEEKTSKTDFSTEQKVIFLQSISSKTVRDAEQIMINASSSPQQLRCDSIIPVGNQFVEIKFTARKELQNKLEILKGRLAHQSPRTTMGELIEKLCDWALEERLSSKSRLRKKILEQAKYKCQKCGSTYALEIDHIQPKALGGTDEEQNLRVLCRNCNQRAAIEVFGVNKMGKYL